MTSFDCMVPNNTLETVDKLKNTIEKLKCFNKVLFDQNNQQVYEFILFLKKVLCNEKFYETNSNWSFLFEENNLFVKLIVNIWSQLYKLYMQFKYTPSLVIQQESPNKFADLNERNVSIFRYVNEITFALTKHQYENEDLIKFNQMLVLKTKLLNKLIRFFDYDNSENFELTQIADTIRNISKNACFMDKQLWKNLDVEVRLKKSSAKMNDANFKKIVNGTILRINQKSLSEILEYLIELKDAQLIIENKQVYIDLFYLKKMVKKSLFTEFHLFIKYKVVDLFCSILLKFYEIKNELEFEDYVENVDDANADEACVKDRKISILDCLLFIINKCAFKSINLSLYFNNKRLIKILCDFVVNDDFINKSVPSIKNTLFSNMTILVLYSDENKQDWLEIAPVSLLLTLINKYSTNAYISRQITIIIGYLANDKQIEDLKQIESYSNVLLNHLQEIAKKIELNESLKKIKCEYLTETKKMVTQNIYSSYFNGMLTGTLNLLIRLAVNQSEKKKIFSNGLNAIQVIIYKGNDLEKYFALKLLAQICFDVTISKEVSNNNQLVNYLNFLFESNKKKRIMNVSSENIANLDDELGFICQNIIWIIKQNENIMVAEEKKRIDSNAGNHIMISYSWSVQKECLQIKNALEKLNLKTWMDVDQVYMIYLNMDYGQ